MLIPMHLSVLEFFIFLGYFSHGLKSFPKLKNFTLSRSKVWILPISPHGQLGVSDDSSQTSQGHGRTFYGPFSSDLTRFLGNDAINCPRFGSIVGQCGLWAWLGHKSVHHWRYFAFDCSLCCLDPTWIRKTNWFSWIHFCYWNVRHDVIW